MTLQKILLTPIFIPFYLIGAIIGTIVSAIKVGFEDECDIKYRYKWKSK